MMRGAIWHTRISLYKAAPILWLFFVWTSLYDAMHFAKGWKHVFSKSPSARWWLLDLIRGCFSSSFVSSRWGSHEVMWCHPSDVCWFITPMKTIDISPTKKHSEIEVLFATIYSKYRYINHKPHLQKLCSLTESEQLTGTPLSLICLWFLARRAGTAPVAQEMEL